MTLGLRIVNRLSSGGPRPCVKAERGRKHAVAVCNPASIQLRQVKGGLYPQRQEKLALHQRLKALTKALFEHTTDHAGR